MSANGSHGPGDPDKPGVALAEGDKIGVDELEASADAVGEGVGEPCALPGPSNPAPTNKEIDVSRYLFIH